MSRDHIEDLVHRYSDAVVHRNAAQWGATWADDGVWDLGKGRRVEGPDAMVELWKQSMQRYSSVLQTVLNGTAQLDEAAGTGTGRWYLLEALQRATGERELMIGHYDDTYTRTPDGWRFASRQLTVHYKGPADLSGEFFGATGN